MSAALSFEYAKSGKAACDLCGEAIAKGSVRLGSLRKANAGFSFTRWHHPTCFIEHNSNGGEFTFDGISGFASLESMDKAALKKMAADFDSRGSNKSSLQAKTEGDSKTEISNAGSCERLLSNFNSSQLSNRYKDATLPQGWKSFSSVIMGESDHLQASNKIAAFDFDGCLAKTSVRRIGADAWSLLYSSIPEKLLGYCGEGYKLVIFTNESNIDRWEKSRQKAVDSKLGRLKGFMDCVKVPMQVFIACGKQGMNEHFRKPKPGMWTLMECHFNGGIAIDRGRSFYVGDAAGRVKDHSDTDIEFAKVIGVKFYVPEEIFAPGS